MLSKGNLFEPFRCYLCLILVTMYVKSTIASSKFLCYVVAQVGSYLPSVNS